MENAIIIFHFKKICKCRRFKFIFGPNGKYCDSNSNVWPFSQQYKTLGNKATISTEKQFINMRPKEDFKIALKFLRKAKKGVNMNLINF